MTNSSRTTSTTTAQNHVSYSIYAPLPPPPTSIASNHYNTSSYHESGRARGKTYGSDVNEIENNANFDQYDTLASLSHFNSGHGGNGSSHRANYYQSGNNGGF